MQVILPTESNRGNLDCSRVLDGTVRDSVEAAFGPCPTIDEMSDWVAGAKGCVTESRRSSFKLRVRCRLDHNKLFFHLCRILIPQFEHAFSHRLRRQIHSGSGGSCKTELQGVLDLPGRHGMRSRSRAKRVTRGTDNRHRQRCVNRRSPDFSWTLFPCLYFIIIGGL
jgi:hypothetical protein